MIIIILMNIYIKKIQLNIKENINVFAIELIEYMNNKNHDNTIYIGTESIHILHEFDTGSLSICG